MTEEDLLSTPNAPDREDDVILHVARLIVGAENVEDGRLLVQVLEVLTGIFAAASAGVVFPQDSAAIEQIPPIQSTPETADFKPWRQIADFKRFADNPPHSLQNIDQIPDLAEAVPDRGPALIGGVCSGSDNALLIVLRTPDQDPFDREDLELFKRVLPLVDQALRRQLDQAVRHRLEQDLLSAQKMESLGTLAGGIAHEINTPLQYIANNLSFLRGAGRDLLGFAETMRSLIAQEASGAMNEKFAAAWKKADLDFLIQDMEPAFEQSLDGVDKISRIVLAVKQYTHPGDEAAGSFNMVQEIDIAATLTRNQWKYVADLQISHSDEIPVIPGASDSFRQVLLNLIVNAVQAIEDGIATGGTGRGQIELSTSVTAGAVCVRFKDNGPGMSEAVQSKAFDLFFTTKEPGRGTGQGLAICQSIIVNQFGGTIKINSKPGAGCEIILSLPLSKPVRKAADSPLIARGE